MLKIDYKQTDKKLGINIYGLIFEINKKNVEELDTENIDKIENIEEVIDSILGDGAAEKINQKRQLDGYPAMDGQVALTILSFVTQCYIETSTKPVTDIMNKYEITNRKINNFGNRYQRRNYNYRK